VDSTDRGLSHMHGETFLQDVATAELAQMKVFGIHEDSDGGLWFGTRNNGLFRLRDGRIARFTAEDGLPATPSTTSSRMETDTCG